MTQEYLNLNEAMEFLGIKSYKTLNKFIKAGLPVVELDGSRKIRKTSILNFLNKHEVSAERN